MRRHLFPSVLASSVLTAVFSLWLFSSTPKASQTADGTNDGIDPSSCRVDSRSGVPLCWNADEGIFPRAKQFAMSATPASVEERERALKVVDEALLRYPPGLLKQDLKAVFVVESIHFRGVSTSGTYDSHRVYLANAGQKRGYTNQWISGVFHAEFSSVLLWSHAKLFDKAAWQDCNMAGFSYGGGGVNAVKNGTASTKPSEEWWKKGFMSQYGTASAEEDFNQLVKYLFSHAPSDRPILAESVPLQRKAALVEKFYRKLGVDIDASAAAGRQQS